MREPQAVSFRMGRRAEGSQYATMVAPGWRHSSIGPRDGTTGEGRPPSPVARWLLHREADGDVGDDLHLRRHGGVVRRALVLVHDRPTGLRLTAGVAVGVPVVLGGALEAAQAHAQGLGQARAVVTGVFHRRSARLLQEGGAVVHAGCDANVLTVAPAG